MNDGDDEGETQQVDVRLEEGLLDGILKKIIHEQVDTF